MDLSLVDAVLIAAIVGGAGWLLYRSFVKNKGGCAGCGACSAAGGRRKEKDRLIHLK